MSLSILLHFSVICIYFTDYITISSSKSYDLDCLKEFILWRETFSKLFVKTLKLDLRIPCLHKGLRIFLNLSENMLGVSFMSEEFDLGNSLGEFTRWEIFLVPIFKIQITIHGFTISVLVLKLPIFWQLLIRNGKILSQCLFWNEQT